MYTRDWSSCARQPMCANLSHLQAPPSCRMCKLYTNKHTLSLHPSHANTLCTNTRSFVHAHTLTQTLSMAGAVTHVETASPAVGFGQPLHPGCTPPRVGYNSSNRTTAPQHIQAPPVQRSTVAPKACCPSVY